MKALGTTILASLVLAAAAARAAISIETVTVGDIGNANDPTTGYGAVGYSYNIGKYEVTIGQYTAFLNAADPGGANPYGIYNLWMGTDTNVAGISFNGGAAAGSKYAVMTNAGQDTTNRPITYVSWFDAARFANWMSNGQGNATTENGAYTLNGAMSGVGFTKNLVNPITQGEVSWWIPSENEWYKAAYYDPSRGGTNYWLYPTQSDITPGNVVGSAGGANYYIGVGYSIGLGYSVTQTSAYSSTQNYLTSGGAFNAASHYGTFDQGGNAWEWNDAVVSISSRGTRGGSWNDYGFDSFGDDYSLRSSYRNYYDPFDENNSVGFRIASVLVAVPEPPAAVLVLLTGAGFLLWKRRKIAV